MDATASREPAWDRACRIQGEMFTEAARAGGLSVQLCHYGGFNGFEATPWLMSSDSLLRHMSAVRCAAGITQIERVLRHAKTEAERTRVNAVVFVGDCVEEGVDRLCAAAGPPAPAGRPDVRVPGRSRPRGRTRLPGDRHPDRGGVLPL